MSLLAGALKGAGRAAVWGAKASVPVGRATLGTAARLTESGIVAGVQFGAIAGAMALGVGVVGGAVARGLGGGRLLTQKDGLPRVMGGIQAAMVGGSMGVGAARGARDAMAQRKGGWGVSQAPGMPLEMERTDFMGATGSLALKAHGQTLASTTNAMLSMNWGRYGALYADDAAHLLIAALHR